MARQELIDGAVTFLQDPAVVSAPLDQQLAFLRSKNLTQEEIDASFARVAQEQQQSPTASSTTPPSAFPTGQQYRPPPNQYTYPQEQPYYPPPPPPPPLHRDWRDWFIIATLTSSAGYALYWTAARYVLPLLTPPTPPQLEQDKAAIDDSFSRAFALLEQLATDTSLLKSAEEARTARLDAALAEVESVVARMKEATEAREMEAKRAARELDELRELVPKAIERERAGTDQRLRDLGAEMKSLKTLLAVRVGGGAGGTGGSAGLRASAAQLTSASPVNGTSSPASPSVPETASTDGAEVVGLLNGTSSSAAEQPNTSTSFLPERASTPSARLLAGAGAAGAKIPEWQLAAKRRKEEQQQVAAAADVKKDAVVSESAEGGASGTSSEGENTAAGA